MVFNFFLRLLVQKLEISKKTYRNRRKRTEIVENLPKTYQYRHVLPKNVPEIRKIVFFYFFLVVNYFAAPKSAKQRHRTFCSAIYSWKKRGKVTGVAFMHCARHEFYYASHTLDTYGRPNMPVSSINSKRKQFDHIRHAFHDKSHPLSKR